MVIIGERTLHGALSWVPQDRDRLFLNYRYNLQHVIHEALPHALTDAGDPLNTLASDEFFGKDKPEAEWKTSGVARNMMTPELAARLSPANQELMARCGFLEAKSIVLESTGLNTVQDLAKL